MENNLKNNTEVDDENYFERGQDSNNVINGNLGIQTYSENTDKQKPEGIKEDDANI